MVRNQIDHPDHGSVQRSGGDVIRHNLPIRRDCRTVRAIVPVAAEPEPGLVPSPDVPGGFNVRLIHDEDFVRFLAAGGAVQHHITALVAGNHGRGTVDDALHSAAAGQCFDRLPLTGNGVGNVCACITQLHAVVSVKQDIVHGFHAAGRGRHAQLGKLHPDRVAQIHLFQQCFSFIFFRLPQLGKRYRQRYFWYTDAILLHVGLRRRAQLLFRGRLLKFFRQVQRQNAHKAIIALSRQGLFRQLHQPAAVASGPIRIHAGVDLGAVFFLRKVGQVLSVPDGHAAVDAAMRMQLHGGIVPLVFAAIYVQDAALNAAQQASDAGRYRDGKSRRGGEVRPEVKGAFRRRVGF